MQPVAITIFDDKLPAIRTLDDLLLYLCAFGGHLAIKCFYLGHPDQKIGRAATYAVINMQVGIGISAAKVDLKPSRSSIT